MATLGEVKNEADWQFYLQQPGEMVIIGDRFLPQLPPCERIQ